MLFFLKKLVSQLFMPVPFILELLLLGLAFLWFTKKQISGKIVVTIAATLLLFSGFGIISDTVLYRLETMYPPVNLDQAREAGVKWVVVLAGGHDADESLPVTTQLGYETQVRLNEGIRIHRSLPRAKLLVSGGKVFSEKSSAELMERLAVELGVDAKDIVLEDRSLDTGEEAEFA